ncbi:MAG TPA: hypothetical protein VGW38_29615, partial [Chloroflexota bacterium]|nr:hypothetical protein [Chloroflexota bacterium]
AMEEALAQAHEKQSQLQAESAAHAAAREAAAKRVQHVSERLNQNEKEVQALRVRLSVLRDVTHAVEATNTSRAQGAAGKTVAEQLAIAPDLEAAVAAALGEALHWIVVETREEAAKLALDHARRGGRRVTYVPKEALTDNHAAPLPALPECDGATSLLAAATVETGLPEYLRSLLANTYLVKDLASALALAAQWSGGPSASVVTLTGELVNPRSAITSGAPPDETGLLQRLREIREIESALVDLEKAHQPLAENLAAARQEQTHHTEKERQLEREVRVALQDTSRLTGEQRALAQQRLRLEKDQRWWHDFAKRASTQLEELQDRLGWLSEQRGQAESAHGEAEADMQRLAREEEEQRASVAALRERVNRATMTEAMAAQRLDQATRNEAGTHHAAAAAKRDLETLCSRLMETGQNTQTLGERAAHATAVVGEYEAQLRQVDRSVAEAHSAVQSLEAAIEQYRSLAEASQMRTNKAERDAAHLEAQRATLSERLRALYEQADRELGDLPAANDQQSNVEALRARVESLNARLKNLGPVNQVAMQEYEEAKDRLDFLRAQLSDLSDASASLDAVRAELDAGLVRDFGNTFRTVAEHFRGYFGRLFGGGDAQLILTNPNNLGESGVDIVAQLPGKRRQELASFSG